MVACLFAQESLALTVDRGGVQREHADDHEVELPTGVSRDRLLRRGASVRLTASGVISYAHANATANDKPR